MGWLQKRSAVSMSEAASTHSHPKGEGAHINPATVSSAEAAKHKALKESGAPRSVPEAKPAAHFPAAPLAAAQDDFKMLPIELVVPSASNPRKHFDEGYIAELAESIRAVGVQTPIRGRPRPSIADDFDRAKAAGYPAQASEVFRAAQKGNDVYEIVAGECRYRASLKAGAKSIPAVVRAMSDEQALE